LAKKTALYDVHCDLGAKMVEFAGYWMPIQYSSITEEHLAVRKTAGLFDVSHMGEFIFKGEKAQEALDYLTINNVAKLEVGQVQYSAMCYPDGGIVDDLLVYRFEKKFMTVVNASNIEKDWKHMDDNLIAGVDAENISDKVSLLALQGPRSKDILSRLTGTKLDEIQFYWFEEGQVSGIDSIISRTGYTGELGYELYVNPADSVKLWNDILDAGKSFGIKPTGLGARDSLRLEMKYCLYGNDISKDTNPIEAGLGWITKTKKKSDFIAKDVLKSVREEGITRKLVGFELEEKAFPRPHYPIFINGQPAGEIASGTFSPSLKKGIGTAYLPVTSSQIGQKIEIDIRGKRIVAVVVETPFYKNQ